MFSKPQIRFRCVKCNFNWINSPTPPIDLKKLYEDNKICPKCKSEKIELEINSTTFSKPQIQFRCVKCNFNWINNPPIPPADLKKLYENNRKCPKCGSEKIELEINYIDTFALDEFTERE